MIINMQSGGVVPDQILDAATIMPGTKNQVLKAATYLRGAQTILGDADLIAANIRSGAEIFGISGTYLNNVTAIAADIAEGKTAGTAAGIVTGTGKRVCTGRITLAATTFNLQIYHNLGKIPEVVLIIPLFQIGGSYTVGELYQPQSTMFGAAICMTYGQWKTSSKLITMDEEKITAQAYSTSSYPWYNGEYAYYIV